MKAAVIAVTNLRRTFRRRSNFFLLFVFPMFLILILGETFGGGATARVGLVSGSGPLTQSLVAELDRIPSVQIVSSVDVGALQTQVERGNLDAGIIIPSNYDAAIRGGHSVAVNYIARPVGLAYQLGQTIRGVVARQSALLGAAQFAVSDGSASSFDSGLATATQASGAVPAISVTETTVGKSAFSQSLGQFDVGAWTQLLLFIFLSALTAGAVGLIETRRLGLSRRMLATPTPASTIIGGEVLSRLLVGIIQAAVIIFGSAFVFGVKWGQPVGVAAIVILFTLVSAGAAIFLGALLRNAQQASGVSILLGLGLAAIGGSMVPLQVFPPTMQQIAHITPHAWANDAFAQLIANGASVTTILPQLGVLAAYAAVLLALATWRLRRVLTS
ncbi:MAG: ABC transporter permease [Candidatus Dormibacterales bacterium]